MKKWWLYGLALALGLHVAGARADDGWRQPPAQGTPPAPAVVLDKPVVGGDKPGSGWNAPATSEDLVGQVGGAVSLGQPIASLGRPVPLRSGAMNGAGSAIIDPHLQRTTFTGSSDQGGEYVIRGQSPDSVGSRPMPMGPPSPDQSNQFAWQAASPPEQIHAPRTETPLTSDGLPGVIVSNPHVGVPVFPDAGNLSEDYGNCETCGSVDGCSCGCYPGHRFYASAEYLGWFTSGSRLPPLLTSSPSPDPTNNPRTGAIDSPGTQVVYGNNTVAGEFRSGARIMAGYWLDDERCLGFELGGFFLQPIKDRYSTSSPGNPVLYRPLVNPDGSQGAELVANNGLIPGQITGTLAGSFSSVHTSVFWGAEANARACLLCGENFFVDGIVGLKTLGLNESLTINENPVAVTNIFNAAGALIETAGTSNPVQDRFKTNNQFYGGQIGVIGEIRSGAWSLDMKAKLGIGTNSQSIDISGFQSVISPTGAILASQPNGLYASGTNIGHFTHNAFSIAPELGLSLGYQVTDHIRAFVGYDFLYWTNVVRPAEQINQVVNRAQVLIGGPGGGPVTPTFLNFKTEDFWAQGVKVGVEFRY